ncbi:MAG: hypothetical protein EBR91_04275 [Flavobacteriia bacterium]|nr:hypothetical protein [Flavobacteriia bacterium]NBV91368.1 hypothetical protein [Flavobacteriia bacterium]NBY41455.1 hypothetical protein [Flavobacteriia bacterium]
MKFLFLFSFFMLWFTPFFAQGNLQFNQVKLVSALETVPAGKVWKIESVIYNIPQTASGSQSTNGGCSVFYYESTAIEIAGTPTKVGQGTQAASYSSLSYTHSYTILPIWIPAGTTLSGGVCLNKISVIEFNIIP